MSDSTRRGWFFGRGKSAEVTATAVQTPTVNGNSVPFAPAPAQSSVGGKLSLTQPLKRAAAFNGKGIATIFGARRRTWGETQERVARLSGSLQSQGVQTGDRVAILALNSDRYLETYWAVYWAGAVIVPMNVRWAIPEHIYSLDDSGATVLIVDDTFQAMAPKILEGAKTVKKVIFAGDGATPDGMLSYEELIASAQPAEDAMRGDDDLAGIFYTGGTTGFPKGVMLSHKAIFSNGLTNMHEIGIYGDSILLHAAPMFHLADGAASNAASIAGATHTFIPAFDPAKTLAIIAKNRVTHALLVPSMIGMVMGHPDIQTADLSSLKALIYGASPIAEPLLVSVIARLPNCNIIQAFGQTELAPVCTILPAEYHTLTGPKAGKLRSAGRPTYGVELKIVDSDGNEVPRGTVGEVIVRGPNTMLGYWNKPEETARTLVNGWVHMGDGGYMDEDGFVFVVDRLKDMIVTGGENVYTSEVENAIASYPGVASSAVFGVPSDQWGETVHAAVVMKPGAAATEAAIIAHCKTLIANYKCPRSVSFLEALPLSGAGKVLKRELRKPYWEGAQRQVN